MVQSPTCTSQPTMSQPYEAINDVTPMTSSVETRRNPGWRW
jgi:hypothetical protein